MDQQFKEGDEVVFIPERMGNLPPRNNVPQMVKSVREVTEFYRPKVKHNQWLILTDGSMYSGWYLSLAN